MLLLLMMLMMLKMMMELILQVVLASKELAGRAKGMGRPAEPDFALVANVATVIIIIRSSKSPLFAKKRNIKSKHNAQYATKNHNSI